MDNTELLTLAVALAMDAFAVAIATGAATRQVTARQTFRLAWHFGLFQALMPVAGWLLGGAVRHHIEAYDHWIAFALLGYIGAKMIREPSGGGRGARRPPRGATLVMLSIATSVDALAVGLSLSVLGVSVWTPALAIGLTAMLFTAGGLHLGKTAVKAKRLGTYAEVLGGAVLILIGLRILWEHGALPA